MRSSAIEPQRTTQVCFEAPQAVVSVPDYESFNIFGMEICCYSLASSCCCCVPLWAKLFWMKRFSLSHQQEYICTIRSFDICCEDDFAQLFMCKPHPSRMRDMAYRYPIPLSSGEVPLTPFTYARSSALLDPLPCRSWRRPRSNLQNKTNTTSRLCANGLTISWLHCMIRERYAGLMILIWDVRVYVSLPSIAHMVKYDGAWCAQHETCYKLNDR